MENCRPKIRYWIPEGMCEEEALRNDIRSLAARGFSGVEIVFQNLQTQCIPENRQYGSAHMLKMLSVLLDEIRKNNMRADLANGFQWPVSSMRIHDADDEAASFELTYGCAEVNESVSEISLPQPEHSHDEGSTELVAVTSYQKDDQGSLILSSYRDLTSSVDGHTVGLDSVCGNTAVFAFYQRPTAEKVGGRFYVVNHFNEAGALACAKDWRWLFEKIGTENADVIESFFCDSLEYHAEREWTRDFLQVFEERHGYSLIPYLAVLGFPDTYPASSFTGCHFDEVNEEEKAKRDYAETLTWMFTERHLKTLRECAHKIGKTIRCQVAYNKPLQEELSALYPDIPENESLGRASLDNLRLMSCAAHLERKRYSYEVCAEFMNAYGQTQKDILWWIKRAWMCGINAQVFHGASYSGQYTGEGSQAGWIAGTQWPGYEAFGKIVSNYWNRTLSEESMKNLLDMIGNVNKIASQRMMVDLLFLRDAYINNGKGSDGSHLIKDDGLLNRLGYTYEFISPKMLKHHNCIVSHGILDSEGSAYKALLIMDSEKMSDDTKNILEHLKQQGLPVLTYKSFESIPEILKQRNILPDVQYVSDILHAHYRYEDEDYYLFYNGNAVRFNPEKNAFASDTVCPNLAESELSGFSAQFRIDADADMMPVRWDAASGKTSALPIVREGKTLILDLDFEPDEMIIVRLIGQDDNAMTAEKKVTEVIPVSEWSAELYELIVKDHSLSFEDRQYRKLIQKDHCLSLIMDEIADLPEDFAGYAVYRTELPQVSDEVILHFGRTDDALLIKVNGNEIPAVSEFSTKADLTGMLSREKNEVEISVFTNLNNRLNQKKQKYGVYGPVFLERKEREHETV